MEGGVKGRRFRRGGIGREEVWGGKDGVGRNNQRGHRAGFWGRNRHRQGGATAPTFTRTGKREDARPFAKGRGGPFRVGGASGIPCWEKGGDSRRRWRSRQRIKWRERSKRRPLGAGGRWRLRRQSGRGQSRGRREHMRYERRGARKARRGWQDGSWTTGARGRPPRVKNDRELLFSGRRQNVQAVGLCGFRQIGELH